MKPRIEIFKSKTSKHPWFFRIKGKNGKIVAQSEGYSTRDNAHKGISAVYLSCVDYYSEHFARAWKTVAENLGKKFK